MSKTLTEKDYAEAAHSLRVTVAVIKAVAEVEARGAGFLPDGQAKILFEPHIFGRYTGYKYNKSHPHLSSTKWNKQNYGAAGAYQHKKLQEAVLLDREAALMSASWGYFQIMGFNWKVCGYKSLQAFINDVVGSAGGQLRAFVGYVKGRGLADELQRRDWAGFAFGYNGSGYKENQYDTKLSKAYDKYK